MILDTEAIWNFISRGNWKAPFESGVVSQGAKLARARLVRSVRGELLETGDAEIRAVVMEKNGGRTEPALVFWLENGDVVFEADCSCDVKANCEHAAAVFQYLTKGKGARVEIAFGKNPQADKVIESQSEIQTGADFLRGRNQETNNLAASNEKKWIIRVERNPEDSDWAWIPDVFAKAWIVIDGKKRPLASGSAISKGFDAEREGVAHLDSLGLLPGAEEPPVSLRKSKLPSFDSRLWAPDKKRFPHARLFWQKFWIEWGPALQDAGWEVQYAPNVQIKPLRFQTEGWSAEIVDEGKGWFHFSAGFEIEGEKFELQPILAALVNNHFLENTARQPPGQEFLVFLPDGRGVSVPIGRFRKILTVLGELLDFQFTDGPIHLSKVDAAQLATGLAEEGDDETEDELKFEIPAEIEQLAARLEDFSGLETAPVPSGLKATLRDYQQHGYDWMQFLARHGLNGILADDMGLGKTMQTLTHLLAEKETGRNGGLPSLVIAPTSVVENWQREAAKFAPDLSVLVLQGSGRKQLFSQIDEYDLVLSSYALVFRDLGIFLHHSFHLVVLDEAQHIKNPAAQTTRSVSELQSRLRLCLSGTPVENHLGELWSLFHFLMPGMLGTQEAFRSSYQTPIEKEKNEARREHLARRVGPLILRRSKHDVAKELPPKTEILHTIELSSEQKDLYETVRSTMDRRVREALKLQGRENQLVFLDALLKLRQICCHPRLLKNGTRSEDSAKFDYLVDLIATLRSEEHRILIFSQFTSMLALIEEHLQSVSCSYLRLTGESKNRQDLVERFQGGEGEVFLISLKAGGTGLTLTGADTVIHYDPWWNPAAQDQATDRAYRIGQDKAVFVHKLICKDTVEDRIRKMQDKKSGIAEGLLSGASRGLDLTPEILSELFSPVT